MNEYIVKNQWIKLSLGPLISAICQYGEALDVYSNTYSLAMAPLWGSIKVLLHVKCKLCSVEELNERLDCKSMEIKRNIYIKVEP